MNLRRRFVLFRCAITGKTVTPEYAAENPDTTTRETNWSRKHELMRIANLIDQAADKSANAAESRGWLGAAEIVRSEASK